jgi:hypothetical protein
VGLEEAEVRRQLRELHDDHHLVLEPTGDAVRMAHPFSAKPMGFVVRDEGDGLWWGGCAWDSFGIAAALGREVEILTRCPSCGTALTVASGPSTPPPAELVVRLPWPAARWWDDVVTTCTNIRLFCNRGHAASYASTVDPDDGSIVAADVMWRLSVPWYGDRLDDDYEPQSQDHRRSLLADQGLTGPFWALP